MLARPQRAQGEVGMRGVRGADVDDVDVVGVGWGAFWMPRPETVPAQWKAIEPLVASGQLSPVLGEVRPLERAGEAIAEMEERRATGKLVLTL